MLDIMFEGNLHENLYKVRACTRGYRSRWPTKAVARRQLGRIAEVASTEGGSLQAG